jgi:hypothetical protein
MAVSFAGGAGVAAKVPLEGGVGRSAAAIAVAGPVVGVVERVSDDGVATTVPGSLVTGSLVDGAAPLARGLGDSFSLSSSSESSVSCSGVAVGMRSNMPMTVSVMLSPGGAHRWPAAACASARESNSAKLGFCPSAGSAVAMTAQPASRMRQHSTVISPPGPSVHPWSVYALSGYLRRTVMGEQNQTRFRCPP